jgi:hypothetical protein
MRCAFYRSKKLPEFFIGESDVAYDVAHRDCVNRVVSRDRDDMSSVGHHCVLTLTNDPISKLFQCSNRIKMVDAWKFGHRYTSTSTCFPPVDLASS